MSDLPEATPDATAETGSAEYADPECAATGRVRRG